MSVTVVPKPTPDEQPEHCHHGECTTSTEGLPGDQCLEHRDTPVFDAVVFQNHEVCSNCFTRVKRDGERTTSATLGRTEEQHDEYGELCTYPPRTTCLECGVVRCRALDDSLSKLAALQCATTLVERLEEAGYPVDEYELRRFIRAAKGRPDLEAWDTEIFRYATRRAIRIEAQR